MIEKIKSFILENYDQDEVIELSSKDLYVDFNLNNSELELEPYEEVKYLLNQAMYEELLPRYNLEFFNKIECEKTRLYAAMVKEGDSWHFNVPECLIGSLDDIKSECEKWLIVTSETFGKDDEKEELLPREEAIEKYNSINNCEDKMSGLTDIFKNERYFPRGKVEISLEDLEEVCADKFISKLKKDNEICKVKSEDLESVIESIIENDLETKAITSPQFHHNQKLIESAVSKMGPDKLIAEFYEESVYFKEIKRTRLNDLKKKISKLLVGDLRVALTLINQTDTDDATARKCFNRLRRSERLRPSIILECPIYSIKEKKELLNEYGFETKEILKLIQTQKDLDLAKGIINFKSINNCDLYTVATIANNLDLSARELDELVGINRYELHDIEKFKNIEIKKCIFKNSTIKEKMNHFNTWYIFDKDELVNSIDEIIENIEVLSEGFIFKLYKLATKREQKSKLLNAIERNRDITSVINTYFDLYENDDKERIASKAFETLTPAKLRDVFPMIAPYLSEKHSLKMYAKTVNTVDGAKNVLQNGIKDKKLREKAIKKMAKSASYDLKDIYEFLVTDEEIKLYLDNSKKIGLSLEKIKERLDLFIDYLSPDSAVLLENVNRFPNLKIRVLTHLGEVKKKYDYLKKLNECGFLEDNFKEVKAALGAKEYQKYANEFLEDGEVIKGFKAKKGSVEELLLRMRETECEIGPEQATQIAQNYEDFLLKLDYKSNLKVLKLITESCELSEYRYESVVSALQKRLGTIEAFECDPAVSVDIITEIKEPNFSSEEICNFLDEKGLWEVLSHNYWMSSFLEKFNLYEHFNRLISSKTLKIGNIEPDFLVSHLENMFVRRDSEFIADYLRISDVYDIRKHVFSKIDTIEEFELLKEAANAVGDEDVFSAIFEDFENRFPVDEYFLCGYKNYKLHSKGMYEKSEKFIKERPKLAAKNYKELIRHAKHESAAELKRVIEGLLLSDLENSEEILSYILGNNLASHIPSELKRNLSKEDYLKIAKQTEDEEIFGFCLRRLDAKLKKSLIPKAIEMLKAGSNVGRFYEEDQDFALKVITHSPSNFRITKPSSGYIVHLTDNNGMNIFPDIFTYGENEITCLLDDDSALEFFLNLIKPFEEMNGLKGKLNFKNGKFSAEGHVIDLERKDVQISCIQDNLEDAMMALYMTKADQELDAQLEITSSLKLMMIRVNVDMGPLFKNDSSNEKREAVLNLTKKKLENLEEDFNSILGELDSEKPFGIEIEFSSIIPRAELADRINGEIGDDTLQAHQNYFHSNGSSWDIKYDGSVRGEHSAEVVSPKLYGEDGISQLSSILDAIEKMNSKELTVVSDSKFNCGIHVHHEASDIIAAKEMQDQIKEVLFRIQGPLYSICHKGRSSNTYCEKMSVGKKGILNPYRGGFNFTKYGTIEFRMREGMMDKAAIIRWIRLTQAIVNVIRNELKNSFKEGLTKNQQAMAALDAISIEKAIQIKGQKDGYFGADEYVETLQIFDFFNEKAA